MWQLMIYSFREVGWVVSSTNSISKLSSTASYGLSHSELFITITILSEIDGGQKDNVSLVNHIFYPIYKLWQ